MPDHFVSGLYFKACNHIGLSSGIVQKNMQAVGNARFYSDMVRSWTDGGFGKRKLKSRHFSYTPS